LTAAEWILAHRALGYGRLLTARGHLVRAAAELDRMLGVLEQDNAALARVELGMERVLSSLVNATKALQVVPTVRKT
jgi:hypothetical protein